MSLAIIWDSNHLQSVEVDRDETTSSEDIKLEWFDNIGARVLFYETYPNENPISFLGEKMTEEAFVALKESQDIVFPMFVRVHSGILVSLDPFHDHQWDSFLAGFAVFARSNWEKNFPEIPFKKVNVRMVLKESLNLLAAYMNGRLFEVRVNSEAEDCTFNGFASRDQALDWIKREYPWAKFQEGDFDVRYTLKS